MAVVRNTYTIDFKCEVCDEYLQSDRTLRDVAQSHGLNESMFLCGKGMWYWVLLADYGKTTKPSIPSITSPR